MKDDIICTLISINNKEKIFEEFKKSINSQKNVKYELISIDNCNGEYNSARKAFNEAIKKSNGKYLIFIHPDIRFLTGYDLLSIINEIKKIHDFGVIGVAGTPKELIKGKRVIYSNIVHGKNKQAAGKKIFDAKEVQTVDECLFIIKKEDALKMGFSEKEGWHLYAVEQCLRMEKLLKKKNYVIPIKVWHMSNGKSLDSNYVMQMKILIDEYKNYTSVINTTVKKWNTRGLYAKLYIWYYYLKQKIKKIIRGKK